MRGALRGRKVLAAGGAAASAAVVAIAAGGGGGEGWTCHLTATTATFNSQLAATSGGQTLCLEAGTYNLNTDCQAPFNTSKPSTVTLKRTNGTAQSAVQIGAGLCVSSQAANITFDGLTMQGGVFTGDPTNMDIINSTFTGLFKIAADEISNADIDLVNNTHNGLDVSAFSDGRIHLSSRNDAAQADIRIANSTFGNGGNADGILSGANGVVIEDNVFENFTQVPNAAEHTDPVQLWGSRNTIFRRNLIRTAEVAAGIMMPDGDVQSSTFEDNVIDMSASGDCRAMEMGGVSNNTVRHNTFKGCINYRVSNQGVASTANTIKDNIVTQGVTVESGSTLTECSFNLGPTPMAACSADYITGTPTFVGGASPTTYAGFALAAGSLGENNASDGLDRGVRY